MSRLTAPNKVARTVHNSTTSEPVGSIPDGQTDNKESGPGW
jgi:hypothetical protein